MKVAFVVNGSDTSPMAERARAFASRVDADMVPTTLYRLPRKIDAIAAFRRELAALKPNAIYVLDIAYSGIAAVALHRATHGCGVIVDTGDRIYELARRALGRGFFGANLTWGLEELGLRLGDRVVTRGTFHGDYLRDRGYPVTVVQDGVDVATIVSATTKPMRSCFETGDALVAGLVGSLSWNHHLGFGYGWDLVEALRLLKGEKIHGLLVGDGDGLPILKARAQEYGILDQLHFVGRVPYDELPPYLVAMDVCLSTQTNDPVGNARTTGKLPLYLAADRYVLASRVGEARLVLADEHLIDYAGQFDPSYPTRLAERLRDLASHRERVQMQGRGVALARRHFDYDVLAKRVNDVLRAVPRV